jgi:hypothetical protein
MRLPDPGDGARIPVECGSLGVAGAFGGLRLSVLRLSVLRLSVRRGSRLGACVQCGGAL